MSLGTAETVRGSLTTGHVELGRYPDGPILSPVMIATGARDGPTLWVQAGVHGPEVVGQLALARFLRELDLGAFAGRVVALLIANPLGFRQYNRFTPQDGMNLNRVFPGSPAGTVTEQLADRVFTLALQTGDVLLDLHSGGDLSITPFYVIYPKGHGQASERAAALSRDVGSRYQWGSDESWMDGSFITVAVKAGIPALIVESGGGSRVQPEDLVNMQTALTGLCQSLGMLSGTPPVAQNIVYGGNAVHLKARTGGFWHPLRWPGEAVREGEPMGEVLDVFGEVAETVRCTYPEGWIGSTRRPFMPIYAGDQAVELVETVRRG